MSRLKDALMSLLGKCTPAGTHPVGNNTDEIIECLAAHYVGSRIFVTVSDTGSGYKADKTYAEMREEYNAGKNLVVNFHGSIFQLTSVADTNFRFSRVFVKSSSATDLCGLLVESNDSWTYTIHSITSG